MGEVITPPFSQEDIDLQKDICKAYLIREHETWSPLYHRILRTAGLDAKLNETFKPANDRMNTLLDELIEIPGVRHERAA